MKWAIRLEKQSYWAWLACGCLKAARRYLQAKCGSGSSWSKNSGAEIFGEHDQPWRISDKMRGDVNLGYSQDVEGIILGFLQSHWHSFYKGSKIRGTRGHWGHSRYQRGVHLLAKPQIQEKPCSVCRGRGTLDQLFSLCLCGNFCVILQGSVSRVGDLSLNHQLWH